MFDFLKKKIKKNIDSVNYKETQEGKFFGDLIKKVTEKKITENDVSFFLKELQKDLLESDVSFKTSEQICEEIKNRLIGKIVKRDKIRQTIKEVLHSTIISTIEQEKIDLGKIIESKDLTLILIFGFNGSGKTTTIAKLAKKFEKYKPVVAAGDTFRAASIEQLEEHSKKICFELVKHEYGSDSASVIFDAKKHAKSIGSKLVLADTAGRAHNNKNLMDELKKIVRVNIPDIKILVLDSITGNDIYEQSILFDNEIGVDGVILTKTDVYEKGGCVLSVKHTIGKSILYIGTGQNYDDLKEFEPEKVIKDLLGD